MEGEEILREIFSSSGKLILIREAAAEATSETKIVEEILYEIFLEQPESLIREAAAEAQADEEALALVKRGRALA